MRSLVANYGAAVLILVAPGRLAADGLLPDRINQLIVQGKFDADPPSLIAVFSARPLADGKGRPMTSVTSSELAALRSTPDKVVLRLHGKPAGRAGRVDYFFGPKEDADRPWNDGREFRWQDWEKHSPDAWDNLALVVSPDSKGATIASVALRRGGKLLYDSRATKSYPNQRPIEVALRPTSLAPSGGRFPVLNLGEAMSNFRARYYELGKNPILEAAYADLGQTDRRKYANRGKNWCSEFASFTYRQNGVMTPDPDRSDVQFKNMGDFFRAKGRFYPMREVVKWTDAEKRARIKPGSFASILIGDSTHSLIFTAWVTPGRGERIAKFAAISGNNKGMVWSHDPLSLPRPQDLAGKSAKELADYDQKVYFGVPGE